MLCLKKINVSLLILSKSKCSAKAQVEGLSEKVKLLREYTCLGPREGTQFLKTGFRSQVQQRHRVGTEVSTKTSATATSLAKIQATVTSTRWRGLRKYGSRLVHFIRKRIPLLSRRRVFRPEQFLTMRPQWARRKSICTYECTDCMSPDITCTHISTTETETQDSRRKWQWNVFQCTRWKRKAPPIYQGWTRTYFSKFTREQQCFKCHM